MSEQTTMTHRMIKDRDIVLFSFLPWDSETGFNFKEMAIELAKHNRVLFIDRAGDRNTKLKSWSRRNHTKTHHSGISESGFKNLWILRPASILESVNWVPGYKIFDFFNKINNKRLASEIKAGMKKLGFQKSLLINDNDFFRGLYLKSLLPVEEYVFYLRDFLTTQPYFKKFGERCEMEMILKADVVVANSAYLADYASQWNPFSLDIGQGCDLEPFLKKNLPVPSDLQNIKKPLIGYCGAVTAMRLDESLLLEIAESIPDASLVLIGPSDEYFNNSRLHSKPNIYFLGVKNQTEVPSYVLQFDLCINPQILNSLTRGNYPRKMDEYLASGKPVVAMRTEAMEMFRQHVFLCDDKSGFVSKIKQILNDPAQYAESERIKRIQFAGTHSWEASMSRMGDALYYKKIGRMPVVE